MDMVSVKIAPSIAMPSTRVTLLPLVQDLILELGRVDSFTLMFVLGQRSLQG